MQFMKELDEERTTGEPSRVEQKRAMRSEAILEKALEVLGAEGPDAVTLQRVASELGYVTTALYRYFPSKDAMLAAMQRRVIGEVHGHLRDELARFQGEEARRRAPPTVGALADLLRVAEVYLRLPGVMPGHHRLIALVLGDPRRLLTEEASRQAAPPLAGLLGRVTALLGAASEGGALATGDGVERTLVLWSALQGALLMEKLTRVTPTMTGALALGRASTEALLLGWGAPAAALGRARKLARMP
jgi:AcrR family transcriptional regulator